MEIKDAQFTDAHGIIFKKVGPDLCVVDRGFDTIPVQALAVSNKYGLTFFVHSYGFCVARTADLVEASEELIDSPKNECNAQERSLASVRLPNICMLALSTDDLTIAACVEKEVHFYNVPILVQKGNKKDHIDISPLKSISIREENHCIRTFIWHPTKNDTFMTLSTSGKLTNGHVASDLKTIADGVEAADWSPDGQFVGYITRDRSLYIVSTDSSMSSNFKLPSEMFDEVSDDGSEAHVDMVKWVCLDSMLISCVHMDADGQEDDYLVFLLVSRKGHIAKDQNMSELFFFEQFFPTIDASILPSENGPYMLVNQIKPWEVVVATNRRSIDNHISLLGWLQEGAGSEACKFELVDDRHTPRIELQASDEDNTVVGLAIDYTTGSIRLPTPDGDSGETLPPGPLLLCMTLEGKLTLFSLARTGSSWASVDVVSTPAEVPREDVGPFYSGVTDKASMKVSLDTAETVPEVAKWSPLGEVGVQSKDGTSNMPGPLNRQKDADNLVRPAGTGGYIEQKQVLRSGASEMEMDFVKELEKVQRMAEEVNELMAFIDGRSADAKAEHKKVFTKSVLEDIESGIQNLSTECRNWQLRLVEQRQSISDLCDESMQVDAWRIYVQSLFEQASDCRYQDLWNKQKLHPEMDAMRKRILKVDQSLKQQIAELEEHLHNLELSQRGRMRNLSKNQAISASHNAENFHWLQSLYSTVNTQLGVAEQLAQLMTLQMETLNISLMSKDDVNRLVSTSASKLQNIVLEEQSLTKDSNVFSRSKATLREAGVLSPFKTTMNYAPQTPTKPDAGGTNVGQPDSTRRRRHSVDRLWVDAGAAKTTVKRAAPIGHSEGIFASPKREFRQMEVQQSSHLPGMYATESSIPSFQLSLSRASSASVSMPTVGAEKIITKPVMGGSLGKPAIRSPFDGQAEQTRSSKSSAASSRSITTHAAAPTMSNASLKFSIPTSGSGLNMSTAAISSPQLSFSLTSRPSTVNSTTNLLASQDNFMLGMNAKASASMDSILKPGGLSPSSSSKRSLAVGPLTSASSTAQPPGMQRIGVRAKEDSEVLPSGSHSLMFQSVIPGDLQAKIKMSQMADSLEAKNSSTTEKLEALESTDNASFLPSKVGFQDSTGLMAGARGDKFSSISSKAVPHTSTVISTKRLQESTVPPVPTEKPSIGLLPGAQAGTDMSPVNSFSSSGIDPVTTLSSFSTMVQSLGTSVSSTVSPFVGSTSALFSPSIAKSMVATDLSKFESASSKAGSSTAPSSVPSTVKAATLFGEGITSSPHQVFPPASNVCPPASSATGAAAIVFSENVTATQQVFSPAANASVSPSSFPFRGPPTMSDEEDMEEEASNAIDSGFSSFGGFGLGSSAPSTGLQKANPFGGSPFGGQASSATVLSVPSGQLFKPAAFSLPTLQSSPSQSNENTFGTTFSSGIGSGFMTGVSGFGSPAQPAVSAFGQPAQPGHGQQALGSALGTFGQTRQIGTSFGASATPGAGLGFATSGGFANAATGGGFASAASGGGFGSAPTGGGFAGFSSSGGFGGAGGGVGGGFQSFGGNQGGFGTFSGGPSGFGGNANSSLFTQMRK